MPVPETNVPVGEFRMRTVNVLCLLAVAGLLAGCGATEKPRPGRDAVTTKKIADLLQKMTLEEKVGQMAQITVGVISSSEGKAPLVLDTEKLQDAVVNHHVGSILNVDNVAITPENWHEVITAIQDVALNETRLGVPVIYGIDAIHGANYTKGATLFPQSIAMAATGNLELVERASEITAYETRYCGIPWNFNPVLGLARQPMWPRFFETYGEDPYLASMMAAAYVRGNQGERIADPHKVAACMKHYLGYSVPDSGRDRTPALIPERTLRDYYLKPFQAAVEAGVATVMVNSSEINGVPVHSSRYYLTDILRGELGFDGFVVTDWEDINNLYKRERVAEDEREAIKMAILAGNDMSMIPYDYKSFCTKLVDLVRTGEVPEARIDEAVGNILRVKFRLGLFDEPYPNTTLGAGFATVESENVSLEAAREAITLLENRDGLLPLAEDVKVLVTGPAADSLSCLNGGWTITWQGNQEELYPQEKKTILEAVRDIAGEENVSHVEGVTFDKETGIDEAVAAADGADVVIACIGEPPYCEGMGNIEDLTLSEPQLELVKRLGATGKPVVLVLAEGRPRVIREIAEIPKAVVLAYLPGMEGGVAIAEILFGRVNPSGMLPFTYPRYPGGFTTYDHKPSEESGEAKFDPQWVFGHGLSYTTFEYSDLRLDKEELAIGDSVTITATVKNTGQRAGKEIVQLYVCDLVGSVTRPVRELKSFIKIPLEPDETKDVAFTLTTDDLRFHDRDLENVVEPGEFQVWVGPRSTAGLEGSFKVVP